MSAYYNRWSGGQNGACHHHRPQPTNHYADGVWLVVAEVDPTDENLAEAIAVEIASAIDLRLNGPSNPIEQLLPFAT